MTALRRDTAMPEGRTADRPTTRPSLAAQGFLIAILPLALTFRVLGADPPPPPGPPRLATIEDFAPPEEFVMVGPVKTHFVARGESGPAVVLVHGFGSSTYTWRQTLDALSGRYRVFAVDMKGFGLTAKPKDGAYYPDAFAAHLLGFLDALKLKRVVLVGHSMGGAVAVRLAVRHPDRVSGLVLVAAAPAGWGRGGDVLEALGGPGQGVEKPEGAAEVPKARSGLAARLLPALLRATMTRERVEAGLKGSFHDPKFVTPEMVDVYYRPITIEGAAEALAAMLNPPTAALVDDMPPLDTLDVPTLIVRGTHDKVVPRVVAEQYARTWPHARTALFPQSGHMPHEEEAEAFNARLLEFLGGLPAAPSGAPPQDTAPGNTDHRP